MAQNAKKTAAKQPGAKKPDAKASKPANDGWLPTQRALIKFKEGGNSLRALGETAGVNDSMLSRATTIPGRELDPDTLERLVAHVPGMREAIAEQMAAAAARFGLAAPAATAPAQNAMLADGRTMLPLIAIHQSLRINPRKTFDEDYIAELADSIADKGLLENLIVRASAEPGKYEIVGGERRYRALSLLVLNNLWDAEAANVPVRIVEADEAEARAIALVENLQRVEISPLEEAGAFAELQNLDPNHWTTQEIARAIGKDNESGHRYVLQRLSLVNKLNKEARDLLENGTITFEKARFLTQFGPAAQDAIIVEIERGDPDLHGLFESFRKRAQAIADAIAPKPAREKKSAEAGKGQADSEARNADPATDRAPQYRATIVPGATPATAQPSAGLADIAPELLALGLPDPSAWVLKTSTEALLTITLQAPSQEAFDAALQLFAAAQAGAKDKAA